MADGVFRDEQWKKIALFLRTRQNIYLGKQRDCRRFVEAVLWTLQSGEHWRNLPPAYGKWNSIYKRYARWCDGGVWQEMIEHFAGDSEMELLLSESATLRTRLGHAAPLSHENGIRS